jgi:hypothetical protein
MRPIPPILVLASVLAACALVSKSPALQSPLRERLAKADTTTIEDAIKACLTKGGWKPDDVGGYVEGATVVSAKNAAKERVSVYIQAPQSNPRVTGGPGYDDPFWGCLKKEVSGEKSAPAAAPSPDVP